LSYQDFELSRGARASKRENGGKTPPHRGHGGLVILEGLEVLEILGILERLAAIGREVEAVGREFGAVGSVSILGVARLRVILQTEKEGKE